MAGLFQRMSTVFRSKADKALDKVEDPRETLDYSYKQQQELLRKVRRGVADVATSRKRVEIQAGELNQQIEKLNGQAQQALGVGREDLAREALTRKTGLQQQLTDMQAQHNQLQAEEEKLIQAEQRLQAKVEAFKRKKETLKATYSAAQAQSQVNDAFSGIGEEMGDVGMAIERAEEKTQQMQARAAATDELMASGVLDDVTGSTKDDLTRELEELSSSSDIENQLAAMKSELGSGPAQQPALEEGQAPAQQAQQAPAEPTNEQIAGAPQPHPGAGFPAYPAGQGNEGQGNQGQGTQGQGNQGQGTVQDPNWDGGRQ